MFIPTILSSKSRDLRKHISYDKGQKIKERQGSFKKIKKEFGMGMYTLLYLKWIANKDLLYSTWNSSQCSFATWMGGGV